MVIEEDGVLATPAQALHQAPRLPVGSVVDAPMKGEDSDLLR
jgi:hypothetical protein